MTSDEVPPTRQDAVRRALLSFGLPVAISMAIWDLADGGLSEIVRGGAIVVLRKTVAAGVIAVLSGVLFGLFDYYASRWLGGDYPRD